MVSGWLTITDSLPPDMEDVLLFDEEEGEHIGYYYDSKKKFIRYIDGHYLKGVTHWMPLPVTPKEAD